MTQVKDLYDFLVESELDHYYNDFTGKMRVTSPPQLKFVDDEDLVEIGMTKPEIRRLKKCYHKEFPRGALGKFKKRFSRDVSKTRTSIPKSPTYENNHVGKHIIPSESITILHRELGKGEFGTVMQGVWTDENGQRVQVAIKCLNKERLEAGERDFLKETTIMHSLDHENLVKLYGVVLDAENSLMLVTELAPLRSLAECLKEPALRVSFPITILCDFAYQISCGMEYLHSKNVIHRDLATRNILVFSKDKVKISDFGLSRALGVGKDYYQTNYNVNLKLPLAWLPPESIHVLKFTPASDVWAYGVTIWEIFSYGFQPWAAFNGQQILEAIDKPNYERLEVPESCSPELYELMLRCWDHEPHKRPTFSQLGEDITKLRPMQFQAISAFVGVKSEQLSYNAGDIISVLKKQSHIIGFWKGVLNRSGKVGLFHPVNMTTIDTRTHVTSKHKVQRRHGGKSTQKKRRSRSLRVEDISLPQDDFEHRVHIGIGEGDVFGDMAFLDKRYHLLPIENSQLDTSSIKSMSEYGSDTPVPPLRRPDVIDIPHRSGRSSATSSVDNMKPHSPQSSDHPDVSMRTEFSDTSAQSLTGISYASSGLSDQSHEGSGVTADVDIHISPPHSTSPNNSFSGNDSAGLKDSSIEGSSLISDGLSLALDFDFGSSLLDDMMSCWEETSRSTIIEEEEDSVELTNGTTKLSHSPTTLSHSPTLGTKFTTSLTFSNNSSPELNGNNCNSGSPVKTFSDGDVLRANLSSTPEESHNAQTPVAGLTPAAFEDYASSDLPSSDNETDISMVTKPPTPSFQQVLPDASLNMTSSANTHVHGTSRNYPDGLSQSTQPKKNSANNSDLNNSKHGSAHSFTHSDASPDENSNMHKNRIRLLREQFTSEMPNSYQTSKQADKPKLALKIERSKSSEAVPDKGVVLSSHLIESMNKVLPTRTRRSIGEGKIRRRSFGESDTKQPVALKQDGEDNAVSLNHSANALPGLAEDDNEQTNSSWNPLPLPPREPLSVQWPLKKIRQHHPLVNSKSLDVLPQEEKPPELPEKKNKRSKSISVDYKCSLLTMPLTGAVSEYNNSSVHEKGLPNDPPPRPQKIKHRTKSVDALEGNFMTGSPLLVRSLISHQKQRSIDSLLSGMPSDEPPPPPIKVCATKKVLLRDTEYEIMHPRNVDLYTDMSPTDVRSIADRLPNWHLKPSLMMNGPSKESFTTADRLTMGNKLIEQRRLQRSKLKHYASSDDASEDSWKNHRTPLKVESLNDVLQRTYKSDMHANETDAEYVEMKYLSHVDHPGSCEEVQSMKKQLPKDVTAQRCLKVLKITNWSIEAAVKKLKIEHLSLTYFTERRKCKELLEDNDWDLELAGDALLGSHTKRSITMALPELIECGTQMAIVFVVSSMIL